MFRVIVVCEESQTVCKAFRALAHESFSCVLQPCSGGRPEWYIRGVCLPLLCDHWDLVISHPSCTCLSTAGATHLFPCGVLDSERYGTSVKSAKLRSKTFPGIACSMADHWSRYLVGGGALG